MQDVLTEAMKSIFEHTFGKEIQVSSKNGIGEIVEPSEQFIEPDLDRLLEPEGYAGRLQAFRMMQEQV
jgi:hypothetical protein